MSGRAGEVPEIVNAGTSPRPAVGDAGLPEEPAEVLVDVPQRQRLAGLGSGEEPVPAWLPGSLRAVAGQPFAQRPGHGHLAVLAALGVADLHDPGAGIDVAGAQQPGLGGAQAAGVEQLEDGAIAARAGTVSRLRIIARNASDTRTS